MIDMSGWGTIRRVYRAHMDRWWDTVDDPSVGLVDLPAPLKELEDGRRAPHGGACGLPYDRCPRCD